MKNIICRSAKEVKLANQQPTDHRLWCCKICNECDPSTFVEFKKLLREEKLKRILK